MRTHRALPGYLPLLLGAFLLHDARSQEIQPTHRWDNWYFNDQEALAFVQGQPAPLAGQPLMGYEGSASISDENGELLFYSDGYRAWNRDHATMLHGNNVGAELTAHQAALIVPWPAHPNDYLLFTTPRENELSDTSFLRVNHISMDLDGGLGGVVTGEKARPVWPYHSEQQCCIPHPNGIDYWVVVHEVKLHQYFAFLITESGLDTIPVISQLSAPPYSVDITGINGSMCASVQGDRLAAGHSQDGFVEVCSFDGLTGQVALNYRLAPPPNSPSSSSGVCFSPNGRYLYVSSTEIFQGHSQFAQYSVTSMVLAEVEASRQVVAEYTGEKTFCDVVIGPDERLYVSQFNDTTLSVVQEPDLPGSACGYIPHCVPLASNGAIGSCLPNMFYRPAEIISGIVPTNAAPTELSVFPDPMEDRGSLQLPEDVRDGDRLIWCDPAGRIVRQDALTPDGLGLQRNGLASAPYVLQLIRKGKIVARGRVMLH